MFISYRRADSSGHAGRLEDAFEARHWTVIRDVKDLQPGDPFEQALGNLVSSVSAMIVVIGPDWAGSRPAAAGSRLDEPDDFVRLEVQAGLGDPSVLVVPILVQGATMPSRDSLPAIVKPLASLQAIEFGEASWDYSLAVLAKRLEAHVGRGLTRWWPAAAVLAAVLAYSLSDLAPWNGASAASTTDPVPDTADHGVEPPAPRSFSYSGPGREGFVAAFAEATGLVHATLDPDYRVVVGDPPVAEDPSGGWYIPAARGRPVTVNGDACGDIPSPLLEDRLRGGANARDQVEAEARRMWEDYLIGNVQAVVSAARGCVTP